MVKVTLHLFTKLYISLVCQNTHRLGIQAALFIRPRFSLHLQRYCKNSRHTIRATQIKDGGQSVCESCRVVACKCKFSTVFPTSRWISPEHLFKMVSGQYGKRWVIHRTLFSAESRHITYAQLYVSAWFLKGFRKMQLRIRKCDCVIEVHDARISFLWVRILFQLRRLNPHPSSPLNFTTQKFRQIFTPPPKKRRSTCRHTLTFPFRIYKKIKGTDTVAPSEMVILRLPVPFGFSRPLLGGSG